MPFAEVNDIRMYYVERGPTDASPVVLLHGGGDTAITWAAIEPQLSTRYRVIMITHRGHGRTDNPTGSITYQQITSDICAFFDERNVGPVHVCGHSDGGIVALTIAMTRPDLLRSIVPIGANYYVDETIRANLAQFNLDTFGQAYPEQAEYLAELHDQGKPSGSWRTTLQHVLENARTSPTFTDEDLQRITTPTLLIAGENDEFANMQQMIGMKRNIPGAEWLIVNGAGHNVHRTHPQIVGSRILDFIQRASDRE